MTPELFQGLRQTPEQQKQKIIKENQAQLNTVLILLRSHYEKISNSPDGDKILGKKIQDLLRYFNDIPNGPSNKLELIKVLLKFVSKVHTAYQLNDKSKRDEMLESIHSEVVKVLQWGWTY